MSKSRYYEAAGKYGAKMLEAVVQYFDTRMNDERHGQSFWVMPDGERVSADVGYALEWWKDCGREELLDIAAELRGQRENET